MRFARFLLPLLLFVVAGLAGRFVTTIRRDEGIPVSVARIPLGGFEPLAVSYLWMRAEEMREAGGLPEAVASYRLVTELQPHVGPAWALPAHLLVWTRSDGEDPEAEWRWVREGLDLLHRGLALSPDDTEILWAFGLTYYRRLALEEHLRPVAVRELGRMPEELAVEAFRALDRLDPGDAVTAYLTDSLRLLGRRADEAGETERALAAYREVLPRLLALAEKSEAVREEADRIRLRIEALEKRRTQEDR